MLIDCPYCVSRVAAIELEHHEWYDEDLLLPVRNVFVKCPVCEKSLLGRQEMEQLGHQKYEWSNLTRLWPDGQEQLNHAIPLDVRYALNEAMICFRASAYSACVVMCGKAIEEMSVAHSSERNLQKGLRKLQEAGVIDGRLFEWGDSLRRERNIGAHASGVRISVDDARDVLDFAHAICEYVYVLTDKYERFKQRKASGKVVSSE